ncbi:MAG: hypothetical protein WD771_02090 [Gemmatimonadaceae bacterium]
MAVVASSSSVITRVPRRGRCARVIAGLWLLAHVGVVAAVPVIDARAGHADRVVAHWEDANDTSCPAQHDLAACQLCQQVVAAGKVTGATTALVGVLTPAERPPVDVRERPHRSVASANPSTRAPPAI